MLDRPSKEGEKKGGNQKEDFKKKLHYFEKQVATVTAEGEQLGGEGRSSAMFGGKKKGKGHSNANI